MAQHDPSQTTPVTTPAHSPTVNATPSHPITTSVTAESARLLAPGGHVVWNVADIQHAGVLSPLIADCAELLAKHLEQVAVVEIEWDEYPHDIVRDALLVFKRKA